MGFLEDPSVCVNCRHCSIDQLIDVNRRMIHFVLNDLGINVDAAPLLAARPKGEQ
ncbi:MAG: hypothetical protein LBD60_00895 [Puniceicoccales bacterium]|jgi:hypothetical protein|nr:hypothetical protein [Puniceicoccales bacterium]